MADSSYIDGIMDIASTAPSPAAIALPRAAILIAERGRTVLLDPDGELHQLSIAEAAERAHADPPIVCHAKSVQRRLSTTPFAAYDLLELFALVRPAPTSDPASGSVSTIVAPQRRAIMSCAQRFCSGVP